ncbi:MAG: right-handed parallel beta-helix repeat-containing protein, partial [Methanotrichaceae archaeon]|nr:right-handed parallel beta-helix repeat-containing protein [Methanotrichaceae archaeon]
MLKLPLIFVILLIWLIPGNAVRTYIVDDDGYANYESIGKAVAAANDGDTIYIKSGVYKEEIILDKPLKLMPLNGEKGPIIINGDGLGTGISINANECSIEGLTIANFTASGIEIRSNNNTIKNNIFNYDRPAILVSASDANLIEGNAIENCFAGVALWSGSEDNNVLNNRIKGGSMSLLLNYVAHNIIANNSIAESDEIGLHILNSSDVEVRRNQIEGAPIGIRVFNSTKSLLINNVVRGSTFCGIYLINDTGLQVSNATISDSDRGLFTDSSSDCIVKGCTFENMLNSMRIVGGSKNNITENTIINSGDSAVVLGYSNKNTLENNLITKCMQGVIITDSSENVLKKNNMRDVEWGLYVDSSTKEGYNNSIDETNLINGMPIGYFYSQSGGSIQGRELSHLTIAHCTNFTVLRNNIVNDAIFLFNCSASKILENNVSNCFGMRLQNSIANNISGNRLISNSYSGLYLAGSDSNVINSNEVSENDQNGISLSYSNTNTIR